MKEITITYNQLQELRPAARPDTKARRKKRFKRFMWRKVRPVILKTLAILAGVNLLILVLLIDNLTTDGMILAAIVNVPGLMYLGLFFYANSWILETEPYEYEEEDS